MRKAISMNLFEVAAGDCINLQVYSGRTPASHLFANISPIPTIMIKHEPENGTLVNSDGNQVDTVKLYQMNKIFYKSNAYNDDSFYYVINKGEEACRVDIVMCYLPAKLAVKLEILLDIIAIPVQHQKVIIL
jgi:hypothetical protein